MLPRGWELHDERPFVAAGTAAPPREPTPIEPAETEAASVAVMDPVEIVEDVEGALEPEIPEVAESGEDGPEPAVDDADGNPAGPVLGAQDDEVVDEALDSILDVRTPLLQRAFRNARPPQSA